MNDSVTTQKNVFFDTFSEPADLDAGELMGLLTLCAKIFEIYKLPKLKDARSIRLWKMPVFVLGTLSHFLRGEYAASAVSGTSLARGVSRFHSLGEKFKGAIAGAGLTFITAVTAYKYEDPEDALPALAGLFGSTADYVSQGRYQRLWIFLAGLTITAYSLLEGNRTMALSHSCTVISALKGFCQNDFKKAAGIENATFTQNFMAYSYGVLRNAASGADKLTMINTNLTSPEQQNAEYLALLKKRNNPFFFGQSKIIEQAQQDLATPDL